MAGRPKKPDQIKQLQGTLQNCRKLDTACAGMNALTPVESATPPSWLDREAKAVFREKARQLISVRVLTTADIDLLAIYANSYAMVVEAMRKIREDGSVIRVYGATDEETGDRDIVSFITNPYAKIYGDNVKVVNQIASQFGFSPTSRMAITSAIKDNSTKKDDFDDFEK